MRNRDTLQKPPRNKFTNVVGKSCPRSDKAGDDRKGFITVRTTLPNNLDPIGLGFVMNCTLIAPMVP